MQQDGLSGTDRLGVGAAITTGNWRAFPGDSEQQGNELAVPLPSAHPLPAPPGPGGGCLAEPFPKT